MSEAMKQTVEELEGSVTPTEYADGDWGDLAYDRDGFLESSLADLGLPAGQIAEAAAIRDEGHAASAAERLIPGDHHYGSDGAMDALSERRVKIVRSTKGRLRDWLRDRDYEVFESERVRTDVSLFLLTTPAVPGCKTSYSRAMSGNVGMSWQIEIAGNGPKGAKSYEVTAETEFKADSGEAKLVFAPVMVEVQQVIVRDNGKQVGVGTIYAPLDSHAQPGARLLLPGEEVIPADTEGELYPLKADAAGDEEQYAIKVGRAGTLSVELGFKAFGMDHSIGGSVTLKEEATFAATLVGGHDYLRFKTQKVPGVAWRID